MCRQSFREQISNKYPEYQHFASWDYGCENSSFTTFSMVG
eukprot:UN06859